jgi:diguanylate cyclase (GGDEF)-like protein
MKTLAQYPVMLLRWLVRHKRRPSPDAVLLMTGMVLSRTTSLVAASVCTSLVALEVWIRTSAIWPLVWLVLEAMFLAARCALIVNGRRAQRQRREGPILLYVATGCAWTAMIGVAAFACAQSDDPIVVLMAALMVVGIIGGITARNSPIPRTAVAQLLLCSLPYLLGIALNFHHWEAILCVLVLASIVGMIALAFRLHDQVLNLTLAEQENAFLAQHDSLTGLPNRTGFNNHLRQLIDHPADAEPWFAMLYLDLDGFKSVNDTLGHAAGDMVLRAVAERLRQQVGPKAFTARLSGDEFAILVAETDIAAVQLLAGKIIDAVSEPIDFGAAWPIRVGVSVGIVRAPEHGRDPTMLLSRADSALYLAKAHGKGLWRLFQPGQDRRDLQSELKEAIGKEEQVFLQYQPIVSSRTGQVVSREALIRWRHPHMGLLPPAEFISVAEQSRLIVPLGEWVLHRACLDAAGWADGATVAVNVSPRQLGGRGITDTIAAALAASGLPAARLEIELGETSPLVRSAEVLSDLQAIRRLGVQIALDDFPTGYSSLAALDWFAFDRIKIDGGVLRAVPLHRQTEIIVRNLMAIAGELGIRVTAEGIETEQHLSIARRLGIDELQGYLLGRPETAQIITHAAVRNSNPVG